MAEHADPSVARDRFVGPGEEAEVAVLVVTYQSEADIDALLVSLRAQADAHRLRVIVADNASTDDTVARLANHRDVTVVEVGRNLGYAAGINAAARLAPPGEPRLVLNPDLRVRSGCIAGLLETMHRTGASVVVPRILDRDEKVYLSLHREPSLLGGFGDALFGRNLPGRPAVLTEHLFLPSDYVSARQVDWASGAALLIDPEVAARVGAWDESFFLYSEETDYLRRVRDLGGTVWYEPAAAVQHDQGGSGSSVALAALMAVNRIRYVRKHHGAAYAACYRAMVVLHELLRSYQAPHRTILRTVLSERCWASLPGPTSS